MWKVTEGPDPPELLAAFLRWRLGHSRMRRSVGGEIPQELHAYEFMPKHLRTWAQLKAFWLTKAQSVTIYEERISQ